MCLGGVGAVGWLILFGHGIEFAHGTHGTWITHGSLEIDHACIPLTTHTMRKCSHGHMMDTAVFSMGRQTHRRLGGPVGNVFDTADLLTHDLLRAGAEHRHLTARKVRPDGGTHPMPVRAQIETRR